MSYQIIDNSINDKIQLPVGSNSATIVEHLVLPGNISGGWVPHAIDVTIDATQTYRPGSLAGDPFGTANLSIKYGVGRVVKNSDNTSSYQFLVSNTTTPLNAVWSVLNDTDTLHLYDSLDIPTNLEGQDMDFIVQLTYTVPFWSGIPNVSSDSSSFNLRFGCFVYNPDPNATPPTSLGVISADKTPGVVAGIDWIPIAVVGGLVVAGLFGLAMVGKEFRPEREFAGGATRSISSELGGVGRGVKSLFKRR